MFFSPLSHQGSPTIISTWLILFHRAPQVVCGKESTCQCRRCKCRRFYPWFRKSPQSRKWHPTPVFLPGKFHGQRSSVGCSPWGHKELDAAKHTHNFVSYISTLTVIPSLQLLWSGFDDISYYFYIWKFFFKKDKYRYTKKTSRPSLSNQCLYFPVDS